MQLQRAALAILDGYTAGTRFGIAADPADGLLRAGVPGVQLTWMDAKVGDWVVTPRIGKPIEVQALWGQCPGNRRALAGRQPLDGGGAAGARQRPRALPGPRDRRAGGRCGRGWRARRGGPPGAAEPGPGGGAACRSRC
ncbi:MAG: amylo-alpha-1,6-glucosidase [Acetobacteraceae bacterium]